MPRPINCRLVGQLPQSDFYKPRGIPLSVLQHVNLTVDELEAIRLTDLEGLYQDKAAEKMNISRQTLGRILESAHKKIADALVNSKALSIEGGFFKLNTSVDLPPQYPHRFRRGGGAFGGRHRRRHGHNP